VPVAYRITPLSKSGRFERPERLTRSRRPPVPQTR
jgi:hypothetical protein